MPLQPGSSQKAISQNIHELTHHGSRPRPHDQIVAIALHNADKYRHHRGMGGMIPDMLKGSDADKLMTGILPGLARGGLAGGGFSAPTSVPFYERNEARSLSQTPDPFHGGGLFKSDVAGRTDRLPRTVAADSFVMPADTVGILGSGNTLAGAKIMDGILASGPYGTSLTRTKRADGGGTPGLSAVMVAGGEYSIPPEKLKEIGRRRRAAKMSNARSDLSAGHEWAREFVDKIRKHEIKRLKNAPPPKQ